MKKSMLTLAAVLALGVGATTAQAADIFLVQFDETPAGLFANTYEDGHRVQSVNVGPESFNGTYGLGWNPGGALASDVNVAVNIVDANGSLSDTWQLFGHAGDISISIPFTSDATARLDAGSLRETGGFQTVAHFVLANGDDYTWQFASPVPEPADWALMVLGIGGLGLALRAGRRTATAAG